MPGSEPVRALIADDSHFVRTTLRSLLEEGGVEVVGDARNGREAVERVADLDPDVVTMDVEMPEMDGIEATERIMADHPTPILVLSAHADEGAEVTFDALERGAVDVYTKPGGEVSTELSTHSEGLVEAVRSVAKADVSDDSRSGSAGRRDRSGSGTGASGSTPSTDRIDGHPTVAIAASTGGPPVVEQVLAGLPSASIRVLIVQHMHEGFTERFADRLDANTSFEVAEASDRDRIGDGEALVAAGGSHMAVAGYARGRLRTKSTDGPPENGVRPAADVTMRTAAEHVDDRLVGVVLTGMGQDGAEGGAAMVDAGARMLVQDPDTASVGSMPQSAIDRGYVDGIYPPEDLPEAIVAAVSDG